MLLNASADGAHNICRVRTQKVFANTTVAYQYTPAVHWWIPQELRQNASAEYDFRRSESYQRLIQLEGYVEGQQSIIQALAQLQAETPPPQEFKEWIKSQTRRKPPQPQETPSPPEEALPEIVPIPEKTRYPIAVGRCTGCHSGTNPSGGFYIEPDSTFTRDQKHLMMEKVYLGQMPLRADKVTPAPLDDDTVSEFVHEMLTTD